MGPVVDLKEGGPALYPQVVGPAVSALYPQVEDVALYTHRTSTTPKGRRFSPLYSQEMVKHYTHKYSQVGGGGGVKHYTLRRRFSPLHPRVEGLALFTNR